MKKIFYNKLLHTPMTASEGILYSFLIYYSVIALDRVLVEKKFDRKLAVSHLELNNTITLINLKQKEIAEALDLTVEAVAKCLRLLDGKKYINRKAKTITIDPAIIEGHYFELMVPDCLKGKKDLQITYSYLFNKSKVNGMKIKTWGVSLARDLNIERELLYSRIKALTKLNLISYHKRYKVWTIEKAEITPKAPKEKAKKNCLNDDFDLKQTVNPMYNQVIARTDLTASEKMIYSALIYAAVRSKCNDFVYDSNGQLSVMNLDGELEVDYDYIDRTFGYNPKYTYAVMQNLSSKCLIDMRNDDISISVNFDIIQSGYYLMITPSNIHIDDALYVTWSHLFNITKGNTINASDTKIASMLGLNVTAWRKQKARLKKAGLFY